MGFWGTVTAFVGGAIGAGVGSLFGPEGTVIGAGLGAALGKEIGDEWDVPDVIILIGNENDSEPGRKGRRTSSKKRSTSGTRFKTEINNLRKYLNTSQAQDDFKGFLAMLCIKYLAEARTKKISSSDPGLKVVQEFAKSPATADSQLEGRVLEVVRPSLNKWLAEADNKMFGHLKDLEKKQKEVSDKHFEKDLKKEDLLAKQDVKGLTDQESDVLERLKKEVSNLEKEKTELRDKIVVTKTALVAIKILRSVDWGPDVSIDSQHLRAMSLVKKISEGKKIEEEEKDFLTNYSLIYEDHKDKDDQLKT